MRTVSTSNGTFNVAIDGAEDAPWLVLSHSLGATLDMWRPQVAAFSQRFRVLRYATRGHGRSEAPAGEYTIAVSASRLGAGPRQSYALVVTGDFENGTPARHRAAKR